MAVKAGKRLEILLYDYIGFFGVNAEDFVKELRSHKDITDIDLKINSPGGSIIAGNAIYNALLQHKAKVHVSIDSLAASMASVIAMAGDDIMIADNAFFMIHNPNVLTIGDADELRKEADLLDKMKANAIKAYKRHSSKTTEEISEMMDDETWLSGDEAVEMGFAGTVFEGAKDDEDDEESNRIKNLQLCKDKVFQMMAEAKTPKKKEKVLSSLNLPEGTTGIKFTFDDNHSTNQNNQPKGGLKMHFDENGNLVNDKGEIVLTAEKVAEEQKKVKDGATSAHATELEEARVAERKEGARLEKERTKEIKALCGDLELSEEFQNKLIEDGITVEDARKQAIEEHKKGMQSAGGTSANVQKDEKDKQHNGLVNALLVSGNILDHNNADEKKKIEENLSSEYSGYGPQQVIRQVFANAGMKNAFTMNNAQLGRAFAEVCSGNANMVVGAGSINSNELRSVISTAANISLMKGYREAETSYQLLTSPGKLSDLKQAELFQNSQAPDILQIPEGQAAKLSKVADWKETTQLQKWGRAWAITEETIINDRLDVITELPRKYGAAIPREKNYQFWYLVLTGNGPTMGEDSTSFFTNAHGNQSAAGAIVSRTTLSAAIRAFMRFTLPQPDGGRSRTQYARIYPKYLCTGPAHVDTSLLYTMNRQDPRATTSVNTPVQNQYGPGGKWALESVTDPLFEAIGSATNYWFLMVNPNDLDWAKVYTLNGREEPELMSRVGGAAEVAGIVYEIKHWFVVKLQDYRGAYKNSGAAS